MTDTPDTPDTSVPPDEPAPEAVEVLPEHKDIYPQTDWPAGGHRRYGGDPFQRMNRQMMLASLYSANLPARHSPAVVQLIAVDLTVRCYYTHPSAGWACQEPTFFHVALFHPEEESTDGPYQLIPACPDHLALAFGLGVEMMEIPRDAQ